LCMLHTNHHGTWYKLMSIGFELKRGFVHVAAGTLANKHTHMGTNVHMYTHTLTCTNTLNYKHISTHTHTHTHTHTRIHTHTFRRTLTHTGKAIDQVVEAIVAAGEQHRRRVSTATLNLVDEQERRVSTATLNLVGE
jgi:hypothetical protein